MNSAENKLKKIHEWAKKTSHGFAAAEILDILQNDDDDRCEHGMFFSGAGACPQCGKGAE